MEDIDVEVGYQTVTIDKIFGPLIFNRIRVTAQPEGCQWLIEREMYFKDDSQGDDIRSEWVEWCRIPGQLDQDYRGEG